jgi:bloom syndrome protein
VCTDLPPPNKIIPDVLLRLHTDQLPAICNTGKTKGVTFVVSPLISLIQDQCAHLIKLGILAIAYTGELGVVDKRMAKNLLSKAEPDVKIVYITPEMLKASGAAKDVLKGLYGRQRIARFVIDEAHCVSSVSEYRCYQTLCISLT